METVSRTARARPLVMDKDLTKMGEDEDGFFGWSEDQERETSEFVAGWRAEAKTNVST